MITSPFQVKLINDTFFLTQTSDIHFSRQTKHTLQTYLHSGLRIARASFKKEKRLQGSEHAIIENIHSIRYAESNPYVITGGHFSQLFVRNLGIFFNALLDSRIPSTKSDWQQRQTIALKTVALDLEVFRQAGKEFTTIVPLATDRYTALNLYARPSDSLHAIVYTLNALLDDEFISSIFPMKVKTKQQLQTQKAAQKLLKAYEKLLTDLIETYKTDLLDPKTNLVKKDLLLASARDGIKRKSSFYDNVILWNTLRLGKKLGLKTATETELQHLKQRIIETFWDEKLSIFLDDLSGKKHFSADSFIVLSTQFLNLKNANEKKYMLGMVHFVKENKLDQPFPLHYSTLDEPTKLYLPVRHFAPSYMGTSIWCHWGMEYIKTLIYLGKTNDKLLGDAKKHLLTYKKNIEKYGGYPEVYDKNGKLLHTRLYRSVLHNGWIINYEQTKLLLQNLSY